MKRLIDIVDKFRYGIHVAVNEDFEKDWLSEWIILEVDKTENSKTICYDSEEMVCDIDAGGSPSSFPFEDERFKKIMTFVKNDLGEGPEAEKAWSDLVAAMQDIENNWDDRGLTFVLAPDMEITYYSDDSIYGESEENTICSTFSYMECEYDYDDPSEKEIMSNIREYIQHFAPNEEKEKLLALLQDRKYKLFPKTGFRLKDEYEKLPSNPLGAECENEDEFCIEFISDSEAPESYDGAEDGINWAILTCTVCECRNPRETEHRFSVVYRYNFDDDIYDSEESYELDEVDEVVALINEIADRLNREYHTSFCY